MQTTTNFGLASNERHEQNVLRLKSLFNQQKVVTVASAAQWFAMTERTIEKWCKEADIPLFYDNEHTVVPMTKENQPKWW